jgi:hypothetical protein
MGPMSDRGKIGAALVVFAILATSSIWHNLVSGQKGAPPPLSYPHEGGRCVEDTDYIIANHMRLLDDWRDEAVHRLPSLLNDPEVATPSRHLIAAAEP